MIKEATTDTEVLATFPVMSQPRLHLKEEEYLEVVRRLQHSGYRVAFADEEGEVRCVARFRVTEFLAYGRFLYVDDLVIAEDVRSEGHGRRMLNWLVRVAREEGCKSSPSRPRGAKTRGAQVLHEGEDEHFRLPFREGGLKRWTKER